jgi:hypothetical protein
MKNKNKIKIELLNKISFFMNHILFDWQKSKFIAFKISKHFRDHWWLLDEYVVLVQTLTKFIVI